MFHFEVTDEPVLETPRTARGSSDTPGDGEILVGDKIYDTDKHLGEVKYVGNVEKYSGTWLGVEWDCASRGKHDGTLDGKEYFSCSKPNAGSFIRAHKARKVRGAKQALELRYGQDPEEISSIKSIEDRLERKKISYNQLRILNLNSKGIIDSSEEEIEYLIQHCPNVEVLEIADNLIRTWAFVGKLCQGFPKLFRLDLSKNPLSEISDEDMTFFRDSFPRVSHIILGSVNLEWKDVLRLSELWPTISNLQVPFNNICTLTPPTITLMDLTRIDFEKNKIVSWSEVLKLTVLKRLEYINLCGNDLKLIRFPAETGQTHSDVTSFFPALKSLNLTENSIDDWISVSELNKLKSLEELRIDLNPLLNKDTRATNRQMIIARIGKLQKLEGVEINRQERRDAEIDYVKLFASEWEKEKDSFRFAAENPRYIELVKKWGESDSEESTPAVKTMKSSLLNVQLAPLKPSTHKPITKKVMPSMTIQKLKGLIQRVFREEHPPSKITVVSSRNPGIMFPLEDDFSDISSYSVEEGDKLLISWEM